MHTCEITRMQEREIWLKHATTWCPIWGYTSPRACFSLGASPSTRALLPIPSLGLSTSPPLPSTRPIFHSSYLLFSFFLSLSFPFLFSLVLSLSKSLKTEKDRCSGTSYHVAQQNLKLPLQTETVGACYSRQESGLVCAGESHYFEPPRNHLSSPTSPNTNMTPQYRSYATVSQMFLVEIWLTIARNISASDRLLWAFNIL